MKKLFILLSAAIVALSASAADVSTSQAQAAANAFLAKQVKAGRLKASAASNLKLVKAERSVAKPTATDYYIFNSTQSYVVVSGDDQAPQILMYGEEGSLDVNNIPPAMQWLLNKYKYQIDGLKAGTMTPVKLPKFATSPVAPLVLANCDQSAPYNNQCPTSGSRHAVTGCPATSLSMCYYKWKWPETFPAAAAINGSSSSGLSAAALPERAADWANIIDEYTGPSNYSSTSAQKDAVAWLMRYAGQLIPDYMYGTSASGANDPEILEGCHNMGYIDAQYLMLTELQGSSWSGYSNGPQQYTDAQWNEWMLNELQNGRPIEYLAYDITSGQVSGHAFNVFGVNASGQYYVNWGWSGDSNGYCTLHNFTTATGATGQSGSYVFKYGEAMIIGIEPPAGALNNPRLTVDPTTLEMNATVGHPTTATFKVTGYNLTGNVTLSLSGSNAFSLSTSSISVSQAENGVNVTVTYNPAAAGTHEATVTLTSADAESVTVKLNGIADIETYDPVMLEASNITSTSFKATWTDETPAQNIESYTLYVSDKPFKPAVALLDTTDWTASNALPAGWTQYNLKYFSSTSSCYLSTDGYVRSKTYDLTGYDKVTVMIYSNPYQGDNTLTVATSVDTETKTVPSTSSFAWYTFVLDCATSDYINITSSGMPDLRYVKVYAGDLTNAMQLKASETGDETYRVITGITDKSYTVTGLTEGGTFNFYVVANYTSGAVCSSNIEEVTLLENVNPTINVNPTALNMTAVVGESATATFNVAGANLTGDVTLTLNDEAGVYAITPTTISAADAMSGKDVTVTYTPTAFGANNATITLSSADAEDVTINLNGMANLVKYAPVMQPADEQYINLTKFRADWSDQTPAENVASYTLEVNTKAVEPEVEFLSSIAGTDFSGSATGYYNITLPAPWGGVNVRGGLNSVIYFRNNYNGDGSYGNITYTIPAGYENATFTVKITTASTDDSKGNLAVFTPQTTETTHYFNIGETYAWVVTASAGEKIVINTPDDNYSPDIALIEVYAGDATAMTLRAAETGDATYRLITGITDRFYTVNDLTAGGTFLYKVKALYLDGTESDWSNIEEVTLFENGHGYVLGDVNHDGKLSIADVSALIDYLLDSTTSTACPICGDVNGDDRVAIADVSALIDLLLEQ